MKKTRNEKLASLGAEALAEALLELAEWSERAERVVTRLTTEPKDKIKRFKSKIAGLKRSKKFIPRRESRRIAAELEELLVLLQSAMQEPHTAAELTLLFFETDQGTLGRCDDSDGIIGDIYRHTAPELFREWAACSKDKTHLASKIFNLVKEDEIGVRDSLLERSTDWLSAPEIRNLIHQLQEHAQTLESPYETLRISLCMATLARQIKDAPLFEQIKRSSSKELSTANHLDIAQVYYEAGDAEIARDWLEKVHEHDSFQKLERARLLIAIYGDLGQAEKQKEHAWWVFRRTRDMTDFEAVIQMTDEKKQGAALSDELGIIMSRDQLSYEDLSFLIKLGNLGDVQRYLIPRSEQLDGYVDWVLAPLAKQMDQASYPLSATLLYRALLDSILTRAQTKTYAMGVRYLNRLDDLTTKIPDWQAIKNHKVYTESLQKKHGRKKSFWARYNA